MTDSKVTVPSTPRYFRYLPWDDWPRYLEDIIRNSLTERANLIRTGAITPASPFGHHASAEELTSGTELRAVDPKVA
jgi:hypothetical protein